MRFAAIIPATLILAACGSQSDDAASDADTSYSVDEESGVTTSQITTPDGTAKMESGAGVKAKLPDGFTIMPGAKVISASNISTEQGSGSMTMLEIAKPAEDVIAHYRKQAEAAGIKIQLEMNNEGTRMIGGEGEGGLTFSLTASEVDGSTNVQLMIGNDKAS